MGVAVRAEDVPVPQVEGLDAQLHVDAAAEAGVLDQREVLVVVAEAAHAGHAVARAVVEVERAHGLESVPVEQRALGRVEAARILREGIGPRLDGGYAAGPELRGHIAEAGAEEEWDPGGVAEQRADLPSAQDVR